MLFNSYLYIFLFLPVTVFLYFGIAKRFERGAAICFLAIMSFMFYAYWDIRYLTLILISIYINYFLGKLLIKKKRIEILVFGILLNILPLFYYKYFNFLIENLNNLASMNISSLEIMLPLGISFFTFQQIAYLVDAYKGAVSEHNISTYSLFVSFFPQLIAGPIIHHKDVIPQFFEDSNVAPRRLNIQEGLVIFGLGLFKKVVIADSFAKLVSAGFDQKVTLDFFEAWVSTLSYTFQLYFDFSGYSDMAIGSALLFNIKIPNNFNSPYKSRNIQEFWRRWHITLGLWLREYIYIPLGGNKASQMRMSINLVVTFVIGGMWHGAGWNFFLWGLAHGAALVVLNIIRNMQIKLNYFVSMFLTFTFVHFTWVIFRATSITKVKELLYSLIGLNGYILPDRFCGFLESGRCGSRVFLASIKGAMTTAEILFLLVFGFVVTLFLPNVSEFAKKYSGYKLMPYLLSIIFMVAILFLKRESEFLYFQF